MSKCYSIVLENDDRDELAIKNLAVYESDLPAAKFELMLKAKELWRDILFDIYGEKWREHETGWGSFWNED